MGTIYPFIPPIEIGDRTVVFNHIGKTGGSTLIDILDAQFPIDKVCKQRENISQITDVELNQYRFIRAHLYTDLRKHLKSNPIFITIVRRPTDLVRSVLSTCSQSYRTSVLSCRVSNEFP